MAGKSRVTIACRFSCVGNNVPVVAFAPGMFRDLCFDLPFKEGQNGEALEENVRNFKERMIGRVGEVINCG